MKLAGLLPSRKEVAGGVIWGFVAFVLLLGLAWNKGRQIPAPPTPSAMGSLLLEGGAMPAQPPTRALPVNWEENTQLVDGKRVPFINAKGERVFDLYKRAVAPSDKPKIALMAFGLGFDAEITRAALATLPPEAGLAVMPSAPYADRLIRLVRDERREVWAHLPTENRDETVNEGVEAMKTNTPPRGNLAFLYNGLDAMRDYVGVTFSPNSALTASSSDMQPLIQDLGTRGVGIASLNALPALDQMQLASQAKTPFIASAINATQTPMPDDIRAELDKALSGAQSGGSAFVALTLVNERILAVVNEWITLHRSEFSLVPPSALTD